MFHLKSKVTKLSYRHSRHDRPALSWDYFEREIQTLSTTLQGWRPSQYLDSSPRLDLRAIEFTLKKAIEFTLKKMKERFRATCWSPTRVFLMAALIGVIYSSAVAQGRKTPTNPINSISAEKGSSAADDDQTGNSVTEELRAKREIKFAEKEHQQSLERATEASDLGQDLAASVKKKNSLDREDIRKLDKLEKLAKRIRSDAGGSDDDITIEKKPKDLAEAVNCLAKVSASLNHKVQETPRRVISTEIIERANVLLELVRIVRSIGGKV